MSGQISTWAALTAAQTASGDRFPVIDVSASGAAKNKTMTREEMENLFKILNAQVYYFNEQGDDATGEVGNPAKPFLTAVPVIAGGHSYIFQIGFNATAPLELDFSSFNGGPVTIYMRGDGPYSQVGNIITNGGDLILWDVGIHSVKITGNIVTKKTDGSADSGFCHPYDIDIDGDIDTRGAAGVDPTFDGKAAGDIHLYGTNKIGGSVLFSGGVGGDGDGTDPCGNGGAAGALIIEGPSDIEVAITGVGGAAGADGGLTPGTSGADGTLDAYGGGIIPTPNIGANVPTYRGVMVNGKFLVANPSANIAAPSGGAVQDAEARTAITAILAALDAANITL